MSRFRGVLLGVCLLLIAHAVVFTGSAAAEQDDFYIGLAGGYPFIRTDSAWNDNTWSANFKMGYFLARHVALQLEFNYIPDAEAIDQELDIHTGLLSLKAYFLDMKRVRFTVARPFLIAGIGALHVRNGDDETDMCYKAGIGIDFRLHRNFSINLEGNYVRGIDTLKDLEFINTNLGFSVHF